MISRRKLAGILSLFGVATIIYSARALEYGFVRHMRMAEFPMGYIGTFSTYARELFVETDFIFLQDTILAWVGLSILSIGIAMYLSSYRERADETPLAERAN